MDEQTQKVILDVVEKFDYRVLKTLLKCRDIVNNIDIQINYEKVDSAFPTGTMYFKYLIKNIRLSIE
jgi:hypothetical protein